ncbi:MAG: PAS domain-containing protein [Gemmatimonadota bacterium]
MIVSGDLTAAREVERQVIALGYDVAAVVTSTSEAAASTAGTAPDLVLINAPLIGAANDMAALTELKQHWPIPVLLMVPEADAERLGRLALTTPINYIVQPFNARELRVNIELALCVQDAAGVVRETEDRFFATSIDLLCFLDYSGYFKRLNPAWERALGFTLSELMSRPFINFVHPDDRERTLAQNARVRGGGQALAFENRYLCKDGSYRWFRWNAAPDQSDQVIYSMARDVTAEKQAHEEREQLVRELQSALAEVSTLRKILPICSYCRKIRDDENYWHNVEDYIKRHTDSQFSHGICPNCLETHVESDFEQLDRKLPP